MKRNFLLLIIQFLVLINMQAQDYEPRISNISLSQNSNVPATFAIEKDKFGFIWFGTIDGLYRYDGVNFMIFRYDPLEKNGLTSNTIRALKLDAKNRLWIGTQGGGLNLLDLNNHKFEAFIHQNNNLQSIADNNIWALTFDKDSNLWIGMDNSALDKFNIKTKTLTHFYLNDSLSNEYTTIRNLLADHKNNIWIATDRKGVFRLNPQTKEMKHFYENQNTPHPLPSNYIINIKQFNNTEIWFASYGGGIFINSDESANFKQAFSGKFTHTPEPITNICVTIEKTPSEKYWIGTEYGLSLIDYQTGTVKNFSKQPGNQQTLTDNRIRTFFLDDKNILWLGSEAGVDKIIEQNNFKVFQHHPNTNNSLPQGIVRAIYKDKNQVLWIGMIDKGLISYDFDKKIYTHWTVSVKQNKTDISFQTSAIFEDKDGNLWIGDWEKGLMIFNRKKKQFEPKYSTQSKPLALSDNRIQVIMQDKSGRYWIGTETGINILDITKKTIHYIKNNPNNENSLSGNAVQSSAMIFDQNENLWVGTWSKGLNYIEFKDKSTQNYTVKRYRFDAQNSQNISSDNIISLHLQNDSILWIGTFGSGFSKMNFRTQSFTHYSTSTGLPNNIVYTIKEDENKNLWMSTDHGLSHFLPDCNQFFNFDKQDGLQDNHFFWGSAYKTENKELFFGGIGGITSFFPEQIKLDSTEYPVYITKLCVNNKISSSFANNLHDTIILHHDSNYIELEFAILDYTEPQKTSILVQMQGKENTWTLIDNSHRIYFPDLSPGKYVLNIKASNSDNFWLYKYNVLIIDIRPPWYATNWAYLAYTLLLSGFILLLYLWRIRTLSSLNIRLSDMVKQRTSELEMQKEELANTLHQLSSTQSQLIQTEKMASLGTLVAGIAHELNNPINYIYAGWQILEEFLDPISEVLELYDKTDKSALQRIYPQLASIMAGIDIEAMRESVQPVKKSINLGIQRSTQIIQSLNSYSHSRKDEKNIYSVKEAIDNAILILKSKYKERIEIHYPHENKLEILCNPGMINQLFMNLIGNAIDAIHNKGNIYINYRFEAKHLIVDIKDDGSGIEQEHLDKIFDPFFTTKPVGKGTGLGLYLVYQITMAHNGSITVDSKPGKGTTFSVKLPIKE